jgi:hypothetical protein
MRYYYFPALRADMAELKFGPANLMRRIAIVMVFLLAACNNQRHNLAQSESLPTAEQWHTLSTRNIYFGHQSVGRNILEGIRELAAKEPEPAVKIISGLDQVAGTGLHESNIGVNGDPDSKIRDFSSFVASSRPAEHSILMFKFCYIDMTAGTDVQALFRKYREAVESLRMQYPNRTVVHITMPLTITESTPAYLARKILGRDTQRSLNIKRNQYNELLRAEYGGKAPIFDLATVESTRPNGSRSYFLENNSPIYTLATEWSADGAHLNEAGRLQVAGRLVADLASLPQ